MGSATSTPVIFGGYVQSRIIPYFDNQYTLGLSNYRWANIFAATGTFGGTITIGTNTIQGSATTTLFTSGNANQLVLGANGNVGIGETLPSQKLTVSGGILATGNLTIQGESSLATTTISTQLSVPLITNASGNLTIDPARNLVISKSTSISGTATTTQLVVTSTSTLGTVISGTWQGSVISTAYGGTGLSQIGTSNQILGVNSSGTGLEYKNITSLLSPGSGISISGTDIATISNTGILSLTAGPGISISSGQNPTITNTGVLSLNSLTGEITLQGTTNQINVATSTGTITLSLPQDIAITSSPTFANLTISGTATTTNLTALGLTSLATTTISTQLTVPTITSSGTLTISPSSNATTTITGPVILASQTGNVGIGTTGPVQKLHVEGQCVTGDTILPIIWQETQSSKIKSQNDNSKFKIVYVQIKDIKGGEYVLSLNEKTGKIEPARIKGLLDMGVQPIYKIETEDGKTIKTTGNHPYLVRNSFQRETFSILSGHKVTNLPFNSKSPVFSNSENLFTKSSGSSWGILSQTTPKTSFSVILEKSSSLVTTALPWAKESLATSPLTEPFGTKITFIPSFFRNLYNSTLTFSSSRSFNFDEDIIFTPGETGSVFEGGLNLVSSEASREGLHNLFFRHARPEHFQNLPDHNSGSLESGFAVTDVGVSDNVFVNFNPSHIHNDSKDKNNLSSSQWVKVAYLKVGNEIAVADDNLTGIKFVKIKKIEILPPEHVYDIEVEGTHNFVANGILAHNTYISATTTIMGNVGIGTTAPDYKLRVEGQVAAYGYVTLSDISLKKDIQSLNYGILDKVLKLNPVSFYWKDENIDKEKHFGFISQEVEEVLPELIRQDSQGKKLLNYNEFIPFLVQALKEQQKEIEELKLAINEYGNLTQNDQELVNSQSANSLTETIKKSLEKLGLFIENGIAKVKEIVAEKLTAEIVVTKEIKTERITTNEIQIVDKATGEIYCTWIENGEWKKVKGECETTSNQATSNGTMSNEQSGSEQSSTNSSSTSTATSTEEISQEISTSTNEQLNTEQSTITSPSTSSTATTTASSTE